MGLDGSKLALLEWEVTSIQDRKYETYAQLAAALGVSERVLYKWKNTKEFKDAFVDAVMKYSEEQLPKVVNALFYYAQQPNGYHDRKTIVHDWVPQIKRAREDHNFDKFIPVGSFGVSQQAALRELEGYSDAEQEKFYNLLVKLGKVIGDEPADEGEVFSVRKDQEEAPLPQITAGPGRPRGSRKVRLKKTDSR